MHSFSFRTCLTLRKGQWFLWMYFLFRKARTWTDFAKAFRTFWIASWIKQGESSDFSDHRKIFPNRDPWRKVGRFDLLQCRQSRGFTKAYWSWWRHTFSCQGVGSGKSRLPWQRLRPLECPGKRWMFLGLPKRWRKSSKTTPQKWDVDW